MAIAVDHMLEYRVPDQAEDSVGTGGTFAEIGSTEKSYNNVSAGRRARGYQKQIAKAYQGITTGVINPNNREICSYCGCGSKVGARILTDLVDRYPDQFERTAAGRVKQRFAAVG